jgi:hypothetical protein
VLPQNAVLVAALNGMMRKFVGHGSWIQWAAFVGPGAGCGSIPSRTTPLQRQRQIPPFGHVGGVTSVQACSLGLIYFKCIISNYIAMCRSRSLRMLKAHPDGRLFFVLLLSTWGLALMLTAA